MSLEAWKAADSSLAERIAEHVRNKGLRTRKVVKTYFGPLPALDGRAPRQACATEAGRRKVRRMIRNLPALPVGDEDVDPPREEMLRALGL